jgi:transcriptional regulator with XRE-family HTH domain
MKPIEPFYVEVGRRIQKLRNTRQLSQEALGLKLDPAVTRASIANIEAGKQRILAHTLVQIADALDAELAEIALADRPITRTAQESLVPDEKVEAELAEKLQLSPERAKKLTAKMKKPKEEIKR